MRQAIEKFRGRVLQGPVEEELEKVLEAVFRERSAKLLASEAELRVKLEAGKIELADAKERIVMLEEKMARPAPGHPPAGAPATYDPTLTLEAAIAAAEAGQEVMLFGGRVVARKAFDDVVADRDRRHNEERRLRRELGHVGFAYEQAERDVSRLRTQLGKLAAEQRAATAAVRALSHQLVQLEDQKTDKEQAKVDFEAAMKRTQRRHEMKVDLASPPKPSGFGWLVDGALESGRAVLDEEARRKELQEKRAAELFANEASDALREELARQRAEALSK